MKVAIGCNVWMKTLIFFEIYYEKTNNNPIAHIGVIVLMLKIKFNIV